MEPLMRNKSTLIKDTNDFSKKTLFCVLFFKQNKMKKKKKRNALMKLFFSPYVI